MDFASDLARREFETAPDTAPVAGFLESLRARYAEKTGRADAGACVMRTRSGWHIILTAVDQLTIEARGTHLDDAVLAAENWLAGGETRQ